MREFKFRGAEDFCNYDERDAGDIVFDQNYIIYELLDDLLERIDQGLIKEEQEQCNQK